MKLKVFLNIFYVLLLLVIVISACLVFFSSYNNYSYGYKLAVIQSGSMQPALDKGSLILLKKQKNYKKGDIITYRYKIEESSTTTHRIIEEKEATISGLIRYVTQGDANPTADDLETIKPLILGKVIFNVNHLGNLILFSKTIEGLAILVIIPATIIVYSELLHLKNDFTEIIKKKKQKK